MSRKRSCCASVGGRWLIYGITYGFYRHPRNQSRSKSLNHSGVASACKTVACIQPSRGVGFINVGAARRNLLGMHADAATWNLILKRASERASVRFTRAIAGAMQAKGVRSAIDSVLLYFAKWLTGFYVFLRERRSMCAE